MRISAIDIGSNTLLATTVERDSAGDITCVEEIAIITRLGAGVDASGTLAETSISRTLDALRNVKSQADNWGSEFFMAVGTSALRDANNGASFCQRAQEILGTPIQIIPGQKEAALTYGGVCGSLGPFRVPTLVFDVGGGSTEFILARPNAPLLSKSLDIGTVRLHERHIVSNPPEMTEIEAVRADARAAIAHLASDWPKPEKLIGVAGTATSIATIDLKLQRYDSNAVNGHECQRETVREISEMLARTDLNARKNIVGLEPGRAEVIAAGTTLIEAVMDAFKAETLTISDKGVRWGLIYDYFDTRAPLSSR